MAAPIDAGSIYSDVRIRMDKLTGDIKSVQTGFDKLNKNLADSSTKRTKTQTDNFKKFELAGVAAIGAVTIAFKQAVSVFAETEQSLANVRAVSNATAAEFAELEEAANRAGTTTRFTAGQAADALFFLSSAGLSATQSVDALDGVLALAGATGSDLAQSAQAVTSTLSQFGLEASKSAEVANIFAAANSNSQATLDKLQNSLRQVGPVAAGLNIGLEETVGSLQALFNAGFQGESAGRALKSALADLANQASPTIEKLDALGVSFESVNPEAVGLTGAIGALEDAGLSTAQVIDAFGKVAGPQLVTLIRTGEDALKQYESAVTGTEEAARQYAVQNDTLAGSIDSLKSAVEGTSNSFIGTLAPVFRVIIDTVATLIRIINKVPDLLKGAGAGAGVAAGGFIALSKALALVGVTISTGPLALIAGVGALAVGLGVLITKAKEARDVRLAEEFGDLAVSLGYAGQALDDFVGKAGDIEALFIGATATADQLAITEARVRDVAKSFGIAKEQVIQILNESENVTDEYKEQLSLLQDHFTEQELINQKHRELTSNLDTELIIEQELARLRAEEEAAEARISAEQQERARRLDEIREKLVTLDELAVKGAISEAEALEEKKALREEEIDLLLQQAIASGEVTDEVLADIELQRGAIDKYSERLELLYKQQEESEEKLTETVKEQLTERNDARFKAMDEWGKNYFRRIQDNSNASDEFLENLIAGWDEWGSASTSIASDFFTALNDLSSAFTETRIAQIEKTRDAQVSAIDEVKNQDLSAIDTRTQALLESLGLAEETQLESLQRRLDEAVAEGDAETAAELQDEIDRTKILQDAEAEKVKVEEDAEAEKQAIQEEADRKARILQREQAIRDRKLRSFQAGLDTAAAIIRFLADPGGIPGALLSAGAAFIGGTQIAAINSQPLPELQTGGIVLPQSGGTAAVLAENGSPELALNAGSEGEALLQQFGAKVAEAGGGGGSFVLQLFIDGRQIAEQTARYFNNGIVKLEV